MGDVVDVVEVVVVVVEVPDVGSLTIGSTESVVEDYLLTTSEFYLLCSVDVSVLSFVLLITVVWTDTVYPDKLGSFLITPFSSS